MNKILFIISLTLIFSCSEKKSIFDKHNLQGHWFFFDKNLDSVNYYNEVYVDSIYLHFHLSSFGSLAPFKYNIANDTIYFYRSVNTKENGFNVITVKKNKLTLGQFQESGNYSDTIEFVRLPDSVRTMDDFVWTLENRNELSELMDVNFDKRFEETMILHGLTTREELDSRYNDSSNYIIMEDILPE